MAAALHVPEDRPPPSADRVPTLTEVVELRGPSVGPAQSAGVVDDVAPEAQAADLAVQTAEPPAPDGGAAVAAAMEVEARPAAEAPPAQLPDAEALVARVMKELEPRIELMFEARLREALAPALARAADGLIRDARQELAPTLRELVHEALVRVRRQHDTA
jgi:hypothetical protein